MQIAYTFDALLLPHATGFVVVFALMVHGGGILVACAERLIGVVFIPVGTSHAELHANNIKQQQ